MDNKEPKQYIANIAKATTYFTLKNGPIKDLCGEGKLSEEDMKKIQTYMENHLAYLYNVLLEENNLKKFELVVNTMNKFYVDDSNEIIMNDDGFDNLYKQLFSSVNNIKFE